MKNEKNNQDGTFLITEEGDMGLGILSVDESVVMENNKEEKPKSKLTK